jgi:hypothetical protein
MENNIKLDNTELGCKVENRMKLAQDRVYWDLWGYRRWNSNLSDYKIRA